MRAIWITSFLLLATACGSADSEGPAPTTNELAGEPGLADAPKDLGPTPVPMDPPPAAPPAAPSSTGSPAPAPSDPGAGTGGESSVPPTCFAPPCNPTPPPKLHDCDVRKITCQTFAPVVCPEGTVPTVVDSCYGECVAKDQCAPIDEPVACAAYIERSDGVCSRKDDDPCRSQDPDCKS
ncbi:MAG: hypothetical protein M3020_02605 [Myxococcota bacterium]|jgi:hypothetical protein|nr:hypothetical protein [Myxococcota bacterium]